jgi:hypothetical protein
MLWMVLKGDDPGHFDELDVVGRDRRSATAPEIYRHHRSITRWKSTSGHFFRNFKKNFEGGDMKNDQNGQVRFRSLKSNKSAP